MTTECHFHAEISAPAGLAGIEGHLYLCKMDLAPYRSGFNGQVILRSRIGEERFEFDMHPSSTDTLHASGSIYLSEVEAWGLLETLSTALRSAGFSHRIGMDDTRGELFKRIDCKMRGDKS